MIRNQVQERLALAKTVAADPTTVFCIAPFNTLDQEGNERLGKLLARLMRHPDRSLLVATREAFVFAFAHQVDGRENEPAAAHLDRTAAEV